MKLRTLILTMAAWSVATLALAQPVVDGTFEPAEYSRATVYPLTINLPEGGTTKGELYITNDATNLYVAVRYQRSTVDAGTSLHLDFDATRDGAIGDGDDGISLNGGTCSTHTWFADRFFTAGPPCSKGLLCSFIDTDHGGTDDGNGAIRRGSGWITHEMRHPLSSGDVRDMRVRPDQFLYFRFFIRLLDAADGIADSFYPAWGVDRYAVR